MPCAVDELVRAEPVREAGAPRTGDTSGGGAALDTQHLYSDGDLVELMLGMARNGYDLEHDVVMVNIVEGRGFYGGFASWMTKRGRRRAAFAGVSDC